MPKLSSFVAAAAGKNAATAAPVVLLQPSNSAAGPSPVPSAHCQQAEAQQQAVAQQQARLQTLYERRLREHGPRVYRQPDGSLGPAPPPRDPYTVANRMKWQVLADHCRKTGSSPDFDKTGCSARLNLGVSPQQHALVLQAIGLQPEVTLTGEWEGRVAGLADPLEDPGHVLRHAPWAAVMDTVLAQAPFQWYEGGAASSPVAC
ncbi:hypothetical protein V8C86DRAFT_2952349 [Haematococcus lacustris]